MRRQAFQGAALLAAWLCAGGAQAAEATALTAAALGRDWFGPAARLAPLPLADTNAAVTEVTLGGRPAGWLFQTDQIPPVHKGKRGEISVLVALGADARIKNLRVLSHREDPAYFKRLTDDFFKQFLNRSAAATDEGVDAVTRATTSSKAIIRDVLESARRVAAMPEVAGKIAGAEQTRLTRTAGISHNQAQTNQGPL